MSAFDKIMSYSARNTFRNGDSTGTGDVESRYDTKTPTGYFLHRLASEGTNMEEVEGILKTKGDQLIIAGAGSGKTTLMVELIQKDIISGEATKLVEVPCADPVRKLDSIWVCTFLNSGAQGLKTSLGKLQRKYNYVYNADQITFSTLHAEFKRALNAMGVKTNLLTEKESSAMLRKAIKVFNITKSNGTPLTNEDYRDIGGIITYARNRLDTKRYQHPKCSEYGLTPTVLDGIIETYAKYKRVESRMDFEDLQELLYRFTYQEPNPNVIEFLANRYSYIYIDEFQDTSQIQYELLKIYASKRKKIVAIGDDDQCLTGDTLIRTPTGEKRIDEICVGDKVLSAVGGGDVEYMPVDFVSVKEVKRQIVEIITKSGRVLRGTPEHVGFARLEPTQGVYYVYLMYRDSFGFRIGTTQGVRTNAGKLRNGINIRLNQEKGDKAWLLRKCDTLEDALFYESYYSYNYGIPQYTFRDSSQNGGLSAESIHNLHDMLDTKSNGARLLYDLGLDADYPHQIPQAGSERCKINFSMFSSSQERWDGVRKSELSASTSNSEFVDILDNYMSVSLKRATYTGNPYYNARMTGNDIDNQLDTAMSIISDCMYRDVNVEINRNAKLTDKKFDFMPFGNMIEGMVVPSVDENGDIFDDEIVEIRTISYDGKVYDLSVPDTRNYIANDVIVHNCIYTWRGSDVDIILNRFEEDFNPTVSKLTYNYRCPSNILNPVIPSITSNTLRHDKILRSYKDGGEFYGWQCKSSDEMLKQLTRDIDSDMSMGYTTAILCRTNFDGAIPAFMMEMERKYDFSISSDSMTLSSPLAKKLFNVSNIFFERTTPAVKSTLEMFVSRRDTWKIKELIETMKMNKSSIWDIDMQDLQYSFPMLCEVVSSLRSFKANKMEIEGLRWLYEYLKVYIFGADTVFCGNARAYIDILLTLLTMRKYDNVAEFYEELQTINDRLVARVGRTNTDIQIATVHEFKGKERDSIIAWNDSQGVFPSAKTDLDNAENMEEERRIHYILCTRAKKRFRIYTQAGNWSPFLYECDYEIKDIPAEGSRMRISSTAPVVDPYEGQEDTEDVNEVEEAYNEMKADAEFEENQARSLANKEEEEKAEAYRELKQDIAFPNEKAEAYRELKQDIAFTNEKGDAYSGMKEEIEFKPESSIPAPPPVIPAQTASTPTVSKSSVIAQALSQQFVSLSTAKRESDLADEFRAQALKEMMEDDYLDYM